jgi:hypothetical protein
MKKIKWLSGVVILMLVVFACQNKSKPNLEFTFVGVSDSSQNYTQDTTINDVIKIDYVVTSSKTPSLADTINAAFFAWLKEGRFRAYKGVITKDNLKEVIATDIKHFVKDVEGITDCRPCKEAVFEITPQMQYQNANVVSLTYFCYSYEGGAHGNSRRFTLNHDKKDGTVITPDRLTTDLNALTSVVEKAFIEKYGTLEDFWFENGKFYMPTTFYFDEGKTVFYYLTGEIAANVTGEITVELKNEEVKHLINYLE